jgi:hypothetical protein
LPTNATASPTHASGPLTSATGPHTTPTSAVGWTEGAEEASSAALERFWPTWSPLPCPVRQQYQAGHAEQSRAQGDRQAAANDAHSTLWPPLNHHAARYLPG